MNIKKRNNKVESSIIINLPFSKSESNRVLIISYLEKIDICNIGNLSESEDTKVLQKNISKINIEVNVGHAGTSMRFLISYFSTQNSVVKLTGSDRMQERPIKPLVDALIKIGADIKYLKKEGFPPVLINGNKNILGGEVELDTSVSSQYLSSLLMISPKLPKGLKIITKGKIVSEPYVDMTIKIMEKFGVDVQREKQSYIIKNQNYKSIKYNVEADWSAASYWYEILSLSDNSFKIQLNGLRENSFQGDSNVVNIFKNFGVKTEWNNKGILISKEDNILNKDQLYEFDLVNTPDLAQTIICTCVGLGLKACFKGLSTLKIKETDRLKALKTELKKFNVNLEIGENYAKITDVYKLKTPCVPIETYNDHRMAMSIAPLVAKVKELKINNSDVVKKSYPNFWKDLNSVFYVN